MTTAYFVGTVRLVQAESIAGIKAKAAHAIEFLLPMSRPQPPQKALGSMGMPYLKVVEREAAGPNGEKNDVYCFVPHLPAGALFEWDYENDEANNKQIIDIAEQYGWTKGLTGDAQDGGMHLADYVCNGYRIGREDGVYGVWPDVDENSEPGEIYGYLDFSDEA